ncbi:uncharacterized protein HMPREF1541_06749 [Cyphellophora europaea CBS 101466]|uniref:Uncharacterized protein n=1 Tax=Cyphellophora europaea (strain CBS 101466) TaxID=1220924 RepID=W2RQ99_CYPE1|nr:uncharacterized protein HMPREF1541_06749 [Cyphellophora europaea CBS 101466]ETN38711.1 hypothetical protein HMPREF1541_06749 [Cyphellophora europaea CBS 101466]
MASYHRCHNCGCETDVSNAIAAFEENPHCRQCGLSVAESDSKMTDDLVNMMGQHFHLNPVQTQNASMPSTPQVSPQPAPITYITQHYHHSAHQVPERSASEVLEEAGVNASALLPSQILLFKGADDNQKQRLVELWRIAPPTPGSQLPPSANENWPQTSMDQEEEAARIRWEAMERERLKNLCALPGYDARSAAEPYMTNLYKDASSTSEHDRPSDDYKRCKDPVYNHAREWWAVGLDTEPMEHQYGLLQHMMWSQGDLYTPKRQDEDQEML